MIFSKGSGHSKGRFMAGPSTVGSNIGFNFISKGLVD